MNPWQRELVVAADDRGIQRWYVGGVSVFVLLGRLGLGAIERGLFLGHWGFGDAGAGAVLLGLSGIVEHEPAVGIPVVGASSGEASVDSRHGLAVLIGPFGGGGASLLATTAASLLTHLVGTRAR